MLVKVNTLQFSFIARFVRCLLTMLEPANSSLQSKTMDLLSASDVIDSVLQMVKQMRDESKFRELFASVFGDDHNEPEHAANTGITMEPANAKRKIVCPSK